MGLRHSVEQGECLSSIAYKYGLADYRTIYNHPENTELKRRRPNPNILYPGDLLFIPVPEIKQYERETDRRHRFKFRRPRVWVRIMLLDEHDHPFVNKRYNLTVAHSTYEGNTDAQGLLEQMIQADAEIGELTIWLGEENAREAACTFMLRLGHLDPVEEVSGVQARLNNLGCHCGAVDGVPGPGTSRALREFQARAGLRETGEIDMPTINKLRELHEGA